MLEVGEQYGLYYRFFAPSEEYKNNKRMDDKIIKYRKRHKKCKYCKYLKLDIPRINTTLPYYKCITKDKIIRDMLPDMTNVLRICSCYEVNENL